MGTENRTQLPILIYKGADICYNILNYFAEQLGEALAHLGESVIYYDVEKEGLSNLAQFVGRDFKAVIGFQTYAFDPFLKSRQCFLHDLIGGPKFNFQFDHPIWMRAHYEKCPKNCYVLTHDRNYQEFIRKYYPAVSDALILPPGGFLPDNPGQSVEKIYDLVFLGTYTDYRTYFPAIRSSSRELRFLANRFLLEMKKNPNQPAEESLRKTLERRGQEHTDTEFLSLLDSLKPMIYCIMSYYREKVVRTLLDADIDLSVYGESWKKSPFFGHRHLIFHPSVTPEESFAELQRAKLSLNIMAWHKDGFTERIASSMLARAVVVSDKSTCLEEQYENDGELLLFDLNRLNTLPDRILSVLSDNERREKIAERAYQRAISEDTWDARAKLLLSYCESITILSE